MKKLTAFAIVASLSLTALPAAFAQRASDGAPGSPINAVSARDTNMQNLARDKALLENGQLNSSNQLGDFFDDTVYTPVNPCRIVDTRNALGPQTGTRTYDVDGANFAGQGGNGGPCGIPFGVAT